MEPKYYLCYSRACLNAPRQLAHKKHQLEPDGNNGQSCHSRAKNATVSHGAHPFSWNTPAVTKLVPIERVYHTLSYLTLTDVILVLCNSARIVR